MDATSSLLIQGNVRRQVIERQMSAIAELASAENELQFPAPQQRARISAAVARARQLVVEANRLMSGLA